MAKHTHPVYDTDRHFTIDPITRVVENANSLKSLLMQNDHNSEIFTFELPRYIEEHDMMLCNKVEVHYLNISKDKRQTSKGLYEVKDLAVDPDDENKVIFSWTISENATIYAGGLQFLTLFACVDENAYITYRWNTGINNSIVISDGIDNSGTIVEIFPDIIEQWRDEIFSTNYAYKLAVEHGYEGTEEDWLRDLEGDSAYQLAVQNGYEGTLEQWLLDIKGESGIYVGPEEPGNMPYLWFDTTSNGDGFDDGVTIHIVPTGVEYDVDNGTVDGEVTGENELNFVSI